MRSPSGLALFRSPKADGGDRAPRQVEFAAGAECAEGDAVERCPDAGPASLSEPSVDRLPARTQRWWELPPGAARGGHEDDRGQNMGGYWPTASLCAGITSVGGVTRPKNSHNLSCGRWTFGGSHALIPHPAAARPLGLQPGKRSGRHGQFVRVPGVLHLTHPDLCRSCLHWLTASRRCRSGHTRRETPSLRGSGPGIYSSLAEGRGVPERQVKGPRSVPRRGVRVVNCHPRQRCCGG